MTFWLIALGLSAVIAAMMVLALTRRGPVEDSAPFDVQVYRDQLGEVERDLARGVVTEAEAEVIRTEVSRRLLEADRRAQDAAREGTAPRGATLAMAGVVVIAVVGGALALYRIVGAPGYPDLPLERRIALAEEARSQRPGQADAELQAALNAPPPMPADPRFIELMEQLRAAVASRPDDLEGYRLLARNEAGLGDFAAAHRAQARVLELLGEAATVADYADYADLLVLAAGGYVSPEAEAAIREVLERDPQNGTARYYSGLMAAQTGRPDIAFRVWRALLSQSAADDPWVPAIRAQIEELAMLAGVDYVLPRANEMRGPSEEDLAAAEGMSPAARMEMIQGMVTGLAERLATEGGPPEDWARLIRAYGVLGQREAAAAIWAEAQQVFPDDIRRVPILEAARDAGVEQ